jgi:hypothetical protein
MAAACLSSAAMAQSVFLKVLEPTPFGYSMPPIPELGKKLNQILALRNMVPLRLNVKDLTIALPMLRKLRDAEKALKANSEKLLDQEIRALLTATPEDPPRVDVADLLRHEASGFRRTDDEIWSELAGDIGAPKANGLRRLCGGLEPPRVPSGPYDLGELPSKRQPVNGSEPSEDPAPTGPVDVPLPDISGPPNVDPASPAPPMAVPGYAAQQDPGPRGGPVDAPKPGARARGVGVGQAGAPPSFLPQARISLAELVELLELKLAAMKK